MAPLWLDVLDETARVCAAYGRTDLTVRLQRQRAHLLDPALRVMVVGAPKQGKSQLVNALINAPVCPVGDAVTATVPTVVRYADTPTAALVQPIPQRPDRPDPDGTAVADNRTPVPVGRLPELLSGAAAHPVRAGHAEVGVPRKVLSAGLVLIDTPGIGDDPPATADPVTALPRADAVVLVSDATRELSVAELDLLVRVTRECPYVIVALTKTDLAAHWRAVAERNRAQLSSAGLSAPLIPVSATLRLTAARHSDPVVNAESGFPDLIGRITTWRRAKREVLAPVTAGLLVGRTVEQLAAPLRDSLAATGTSEPLARLHRAQRALDDLRRCSVRWQNTLTDEVTDLISDIEYDLRDRTRQILREVDDAFDDADPDRTWESFRSWLDEALVEAAEANVDWLLRRCEWIADRVADHFLPYGADPPPEWRANIPDLPDRRRAPIGGLTVERFTLTQKLFTGLRGSYVGLLMFGLATTVAGMPLINPVSLGAGLAFGAKSIWDESRSHLKRRQAAAKSVAQRHVEDFVLHLTKECRDATRAVQRLLRDHYTTQTEQIQDDIVHSLRSAKVAADADAAERDQRQREIQQQMRRLATLYERAKSLTAGSRRTQTDGRVVSRA